MEGTGLSPGDPGSFSRPDHVVVKHMDIELDVDFRSQKLSGKVILRIEVLSKETDTLILDSKNLNIQGVSSVNEEPLEYEVGDEIGLFGRKISIWLNKPLDSVVIKYETNKDAAALQWLTPAQTAGGKFPYLFSQCQPDHCRSIIPCQDTPSVKGTYTAKITVDKELTALMSAVKDGCEVKKGNGKMEYSFRQDVPIPSYLITIAVGNLTSRKLGPRSHVWSEPEIIDAAEYEFSETDELLKVAEEICGKYVWKIYDLLVLPPSFPFGGMENPCLTFVTPTILAGDRSLVAVISHEIAHSWTGNLISIKNFEHFWLNEGFTTFIERKINGRLKGESFRQFEAIGGLKDLKQSIQSLGETNPFTNLVVNLKGVPPDDAFSTCPYEKGHTFLFYLEELVGGPDVFEPFLKSYFEEFKYKSIETIDFKNYLYSYFKGNEQLKNVDWDLWLYSPGMPPVIPNYDRSLQNACDELCTKWINWDVNTECPFSTTDITNLLPAQIEVFVACLLEQPRMQVKKVQVMRDLYNMDSFQNQEIKFRWIRLCLKARLDDKVDTALEFVTQQGRMKFVRPIFRDLYDWEEYRDRAINKFYEHKGNMMQVLVLGLESDLHVKNV